MTTESEKLEAYLKRIRETLNEFQPPQDLEILTQKISRFEQFEKDALGMVEDLKTKGLLSPDEERQLKVHIAECEHQPEVT